jgi:hypothetical protein
MQDETIFFTESPTDDEQDSAAVQFVVSILLDASAETESSTSILAQLDKIAHSFTTNPPYDEPTTISLNAFKALGLGTK